jgi:hypothetical protein
LRTYPWQLRRTKKKLNKGRSNITLSYLEYDVTWVGSLKLLITEWFCLVKYSEKLPSVVGGHLVSLNLSL